MVNPSEISFNIRKCRADMEDTISTKLEIMENHTAQMAISIKQAAAKEAEISIMQSIDSKMADYFTRATK